MKTILLLLSIQIIAFGAFGQNKSSHTIFNAKGKAVSYKKMLKTLAEKDIVLFGEYHNNAIAHWLQLEVTMDLHKQRAIQLGAEMVEADNQDELDLYLAGKIDYNALDSQARLWPNYKTDYAPLVDFAKAEKLTFVATNIPRRYANLVYKQGFEALDTLSEEEKTWMAPLPMTFDPTLPGYQKIVTMMGDHGSLELVMAQATKDATMAHRILKYYETGKLFLHFNGAFHSDNFEGILWYLQQEKSELKYGTISTVSQDDVRKLLEENKNLADFIICVDSDMTSTY